jgi:hypothetical protein
MAHAHIARLNERNARHEQSQLEVVAAQLVAAEQIVKSLRSLGRSDEEIVAALAQIVERPTLTEAVKAAVQPAMQGSQDVGGGRIALGNIGDTLAKRKATVTKSEPRAEDTVAYAVAQVALPILPRDTRARMLKERATGAGTTVQDAIEKTLKGR